MEFPLAFSISAPRDKSDLSLCSRDFAVEVNGVYRINAQVEGHGRTLLSGWHEAAFVRVVFFVSNPINEAAALEAVREAARELDNTIRLIRETDEHLIPIMTGFPLGFRITGTPRVIERKRPRRVAYVHDFVADVRDAWKKQVAKWIAEFASK